MGGETYEQGYPQKLGRVFGEKRLKILCGNQWA